MVMTQLEAESRVLIIEDDAAVRFLTQLTLQADGWNVSVAATAAQGLAAMDLADPDVVLLDLGLPDADGTAVLAELKRSERSAWVPVVVMSGRSDPAEVTRLLLAGAQDYLVKPVPRGELHARLVAARRVATEHRRLAAFQDELSLLADHTTDLVVRCGLDGVIRYASPSAFPLLGWRPEEMVGRAAAEFSHPDDVAAFGSRTDRLGAGSGSGQAVTVTRRTRRADGTYLWLESIAQVIPGPGARDLEILSSARDVTHRLAATEALAASEQRWRFAFDSGPVGMAEVDLDGRFLKVNGALCDLFGRDDLVGATVASMCHPDDTAQVGDTLRSLASGHGGVQRVERRCLRADGATLWVAVSGVAVVGPDGSVGHLLMHYLDITDSKQFEDHLVQLAAHDPLTGLLNRRAFGAALARLSALAPRDAVSGAVLVIDLDHLKQVNDTFGHKAGDEVIVTVAQILRATLRKTDLVARLGGDEFAVVLRPATVAQAELVAGKIVKTLRNTGSHVTASVGIAMFDGGSSGERALTNADLSMYRAKDAGRDRYAIHRSV